MRYRASWGFTMPSSSEHGPPSWDVATVISMDIMGNQWKTVCNSYFSSDMSDIFYVLEILIRMRVYSE